MSFAYYALEEARPSGRVAVGADPRPDGTVTFFVEDDGREAPGAGGGAGHWTGRVLLCAIARAIVGPWGGDALTERDRDAGTTRYALVLPAL